jgi:hypothetical protein
VDYLALVYTLVTAVVLGVAGFVLLSLGIWNHAKEYAKARKAMSLTVPAAPRESLVISSRTFSQPQNNGRSRAA